MTTIAKISQANIVQATQKHTATVFFFHGSGKITAKSVWSYNEK